MANDGGGDLPPAPVVEYSDYPKDPDNYVRVIVDIPGLKKRRMKDVADNADIKLDVEERSFSLHVTVQADGKRTGPKEYLYQVKKLPEPIHTDPKKTYYKVKKDKEVTVYLCKMYQGSWAGHLAKGLDLEY